MNKSALINITQLQELLQQSRCILLDATIDKVNQQIDKENIALIPGSLFFDIEGIFSDHSSNLPHTMISEENFTKAVQALGIHQDDIIVIYDRWGVYASPRAWWMFKTMGHENVFVLNGGLPAWLAEGLPVVKEHVRPAEKGNFQAKLNNKWIVDTNHILQHLEDETIKIIDARGSARFNGTAAEPRPGVRAGHIPYSSNLPFDNVIDDIYLKGKEDLLTLFRDHSKQGQSNIFTCGSGITASILALAAYEIGLPNIAVYDGSWAEWGANNNLPIEK